MFQQALIYSWGRCRQITGACRRFLRMAHAIFLQEHQELDWRKAAHLKANRFLAGNLASCERRSANSVLC